MKYYALLLDFGARVKADDDEESHYRPPRNPGGRLIQLSLRKRTTSQMKRDIYFVAERLGYRKQTTRLKRDRIIEAATKIVCYDYGYEEPTKSSDYDKWRKEFDASLDGSINMSDVVADSARQPRLHCHERIEQEFPRFLPGIYRKALKRVSCEATWRDIAECMNDISGEPGMEGPTLKLNRMSLRRWFRAKHGKLKKRFARAILTPERMEKRAQWCKEFDDHLEVHDQGKGPPLCVCFLDEKLFFTRSGRKSAKCLPPQEGETHEDARLPTL